MILVNKHITIPIVIITIFIFLVPLNVFSAEVLQVKSASVIRIGDNNRDYKVKIACLDVDPLKEKEALEWLKMELPRKSKVNLLPKGSEDGVLVAKVINLNSEKDLANSMKELGLAKLYC